MSLVFRWTVTSNYIDGKQLYRVYRNLRADEPDHSGNREYNGGLFDTKQEAQAHADKLNAA